MNVTTEIRLRASKLNGRVLFPEAEKDARVVRAATMLADEKIATPILLGEPDTISEIAKNDQSSLSERAEIVPVNDPETEEARYEFYREKLAHKNPDHEQLKKLCEDPLFTAGWLLEQGKAESVIAGSVASTPQVIVAAIRTVGVSESSTVVSSSFLMEMPDGNVFTFSDCGVVPYPDEIQLASIALDAGLMNKLLTGVDPRIAFLSFSTKGSARHESVDKVRKAYEIASRKRPEWKMDGELQFDTAFVPAIADRKAPSSKIAGNANVFIFPNLDAGNIAYKITERLAGATATGPILQGLSKPFLDLSRGCSPEDIVNTASVGLLMSEDTS
jgi:phosphate acetyltransferase